MPLTIAASPSILFPYFKFGRVLCGEQREPDSLPYLGTRLSTMLSYLIPPILVILTLEQKLQRQDLQFQEDLKTSSYQIQVGVSVLWLTNDINDVTISIHLSNIVAIFKQEKVLKNFGNRKALNW